MRTWLCIYALTLALSWKVYGQTPAPITAANVALGPGLVAVWDSASSTYQIGVDNAVMLLTPPPTAWPPAPGWCFTSAQRAEDGQFEYGCHTAPNGKLKPYRVRVEMVDPHLLTIACGSAADSGFTGGYAYAMPNQSAPFNWLRASDGPITYTVNVPGAATVTLQFIEPRINQTAGARVFSVALNGAVVMPTVDLFVQAGGALKPWSTTLTVPAMPLTITLTPVRGNAVISGIQIE